MVWRLLKGACGEADLGEFCEVLVDFMFETVVPVAAAFSRVSFLSVVRDLKHLLGVRMYRVAEIAAEAAEAAGEDLLQGVGHHVVGHARPLQGQQGEKEHTLNLREVRQSWQSTFFTSL